MDSAVVGLVVQVKGALEMSPSVASIMAWDGEEWRH